MKRTSIVISGSAGLSIGRAMTEVLRSLGEGSPTSRTDHSVPNQARREEPSPSRKGSEESESSAKKAFADLTQLLENRSHSSNDEKVKKKKATLMLDQGRMDETTARRQNSTTEDDLRLHLESRAAVKQLRETCLDALHGVLRRLEPRIEFQQQRASVLLTTSEANSTLSLLPKEEWRNLRSLPPDHELYESAACLFRLQSRKKPPLRTYRSSVSDLQVNEVVPGGSLLRLPTILRHENRLPEPPDDTDYCHLYFLLYTGDLDTVSALSQLARRLSRPLSDFSITQVLEARAPSTQVCSVRFPASQRDEARLLIEINTELGLGFKVYPIAWQRRPVWLGEVRGNYHSVLLRQFLSRGSDIQHTCANLQQNGFINYFGLRKFGYHSFGLQDIGLAVLRRNHGAAMMMLLQNEAERLQVADVGGLLKALPPWAAGLYQSFVTRQVHSQKFVEYYEALPEHVRMQHLTAIQGFAWNILASGRRSLLAHHDRTALVGDTVLETNSSGIPAASTPWEAIPGDIPSPSVTQWVCESRAPPPSPREVTLQEEEMSLFDVVIPIPFLPSTCPLQEAVRKSLKVQRTNVAKSFGLTPGAVTPEYRPLVVRPQHMSFYIVPEAGDTADHLQLQTDESLCHEGRNLRSTFSTMQLPLVADRLPQGVYEIANSKASLYGRHTNKAGTRALVMGAMIPPTSYLSSMLRESFQVVRPLSATERNNEVDSTRLPTPTAKPLRGRADQRQDSRQEFNVHDYPPTGNIMELRFHHKSLKDAAKSGLTPKGRYVMRDINDWHKK